MKQTLNKDQFRFQMNQIRPDNFSYEGLGIIFDYLEQYEDDTGEQIEFDPIAICCDYSECSLKEFEQGFSESIEIYHDTPEEEKKQIIVDYLEENGYWYQFLNDDKDVIFQNF
jgi:hypothetical protein